MSVRSGPKRRIRSVGGARTIRALLVQTALLRPDEGAGAATWLDRVEVTGRLKRLNGQSWWRLNLGTVWGRRLSVEPVGNPLHAAFALNEVRQQAVCARLVEERGLLVGPELNVSPLCTPVAG